jgi:hypothetical protein
VTAALATERWTGRLAVLICVWLLPFARFILYQRYPLLRIEVLVPLSVTLLCCVLAAVVLPAGRVFAAVVVVSIILESTFPIHSYLEALGNIQYRWVLAALTITTVTAWALMKENFFRLVMVFASGMFTVAAAQAVSGPIAAPRSPSTLAAANAVYVILDEFMGIAGFPRDIAECGRAADHTQEVLLRHGFDLYPEAFSNYAETSDSIPSIVNFRVEPRARLLRRMTLRSEGLFSAFRSRGYALSIYQSDYLNFQTPGIASQEIAATYPANTLQKLQDLPIGWPTKAVHIVASYFQSDNFWYDRLTRVAPSLWLVQDRRIGPLAVTDLWPERLGKDILAAAQPTFFFAHLLTPHYPYVFDSEGGLREYKDWGAGFSLRTSDPLVHRRLYQLYCAQAEHVSHQMDSFLGTLEKSPAYNSTLIVIHGDHGSRLELSSPEQPELRAVLNRFSALLAIKPAGSRPGRLVPRRASVVRILAETFAPGDAAKLTDSADQGFLEDSDGNYRMIPILKIWSDPS